jgi:hypothetical protein
MVIFLLSAVPLLGLIYLYSFYGSILEGREVLRPGAAGIIVSAAVILLLYLISGMVEFSFTRGGIFLREWLFGYALAYVLIITALALLRGRIFLHMRGQMLYGELCAFWFAAGTVLALFHALYAFGSYDVYDILLYPLLLFLFSFTSAYFTYLLITGETGSRYLFIAAGLALAALLTLVPFFFYLNHRVTAYVLFAVLLLMGGLYLYLLDIKKILPRP